MVAGDRITVSTGWRNIGPAPKGTLYVALLLSHQPLGELFIAQPTRLAAGLP
jgi:hypothetical protein